MKKIIIILFIFIFLLTGCDQKKDEKIIALEKRLEALTYTLFLQSTQPIRGIFLMPYDLIVVDEADLKELKEQLEDLAKVFKIPEDLDFKEMEKTEFEFGGWDSIASWWKGKSEGKKRPKKGPPLVLSYYRLKKGKFVRLDYVSNGKETLPDCAVEFSISVSCIWI